MVLHSLVAIKRYPIPYSVPSGSSANLTARPEGPSLMGSDGMGWMGWDGISKVSFNFPILCGYIDKVCTYVYM